MNLKKETLEGSYTPVAWEYREVIDEQIEKKQYGKIFHFCTDEGLCQSEGRVTKMIEVPASGMFIVLDDGKQIRIDRIITLFGKPGAAYEEYDAYGAACMDCTGGYDREELKGYSI